MIIETCIFVSRRSHGNVSVSTTELDNLVDEEVDDEDDKEDEEQVVYSSRDSEISKYNSTVLLDAAGNRVFIYYWRIHRIENMLTNWYQHWSLRSPSFYVNNSYKMYLKIFPKQHGDNTYVHVGLTRGDYDEKLAWPFSLKHQVSIIDQTSIVGMADDITSRVWDPTQLCSATNWQKPVVHRDNYECVGLGFPHSTLRSRNYILRDTILIKLTVFLS